MCSDTWSDASTRVGQIFSTENSPVHTRAKQFYGFTLVPWGVQNQPRLLCVPRLRSISSELCCPLEAGHCITSSFWFPLETNPWESHLEIKPYALPNHPPPTTCVRLRCVTVIMFHWRKWKCTPIFLPGESRRQRSLVGYSPWDHRAGHNWSDLALASYKGYL